MGGEDGMEKASEVKVDRASSMGWKSRGIVATHCSDGAKGAVDVILRNTV